MRIIKTDGASAKEERGTRDGIELSLRPEYYRCDYCGVAMARDGHEKCRECKRDVTAPVIAYFK